MPDVNNKGVANLLVITKYVIAITVAVEQIIADKTNNWLKILFSNIGLFESIPDIIAAGKEVPAELYDQITEDELIQIETPIFATDVIPEAKKEFVKDLISLVNHIKSFVIKYFVSQPVVTAVPPVSSIPPVSPVV